MQPEPASDAPDLERELAARLAALDETGTADAAQGLGELTAGLGPEAAERLGGALECLERIRGLWPRPELRGDWPQQFGKFLLERELGRGGHGVVFLALDPTLGRRVALKIPRPECLDDPDLKRRFLKEARAVAMLDHPGIVPLLELGEVGPVCFMASTYCSGPDLDAWLKNRPEPLSPRVAAHLAAEIAVAIGHAHARGVVHRDLKPRNILLEEAASADLPDDLAVRPRVTDFGLAKLLEVEAELTRTGLVIGTPRYMAPEQALARHHAIGPPTDVYAIGAILEELLIGRHLDLTADDYHAAPCVPPGAGARSASSEAPPTTEPSCAQSKPPPPPVPAALKAIVFKCLEQEPSRRYADAALLAADLRRFLGGERVHAVSGSILRSVRAWAAQRPKLVISTVAVASIALTVIALEYQRGGRSGPTPAPSVVRAAGHNEAERLARINRYVDDLRLAREQSPVEDPVTYKLQQANFLLDRHRPGPGDEDVRSIDWFYLWTQLHGERQTLADHQGELFWLTYSPDGQSLASAGVDGARVWDAATGTLRLSLRQHTDEVNWISFSPDSKRLATASDDRTARVWSALDGSPVVPPLVHQNKVVAALFTPDGRQLITADRGGIVTIWDAKTGDYVRRFPAGASIPLEGMALSPDGAVLATAASNEVTLWEFPELRRRRVPIVIDGIGHRFDCVAFSHDGRRFATASGSAMSVRVWDTSTGQLLFSGTHHPAEGVRSVAFSPDDRTLLSTGTDFAVRLWDLSGGRAEAILAGHSDWVWCGTFSPDGKTVATTGKDGTVKLWTHPYTSGRGAIEPSVHACHAVGYSTDGRHLYTLVNAGKCELWDSESGRPVKVLPFSTEKPPVAALFSPGSSWIAAVDAEGTISIGSPHQAKPFVILTHAAAERPCLAFSGDSRTLAFVARNGSVGRFDVSAPKSTVEELESPGSKPTCLAYAASAALLAGGIERRLVVWDLQTGRVRGVSQTTTQREITTVAISPDGSVCATSGQGPEILLWDTATLDVRARSSDTQETIDCVAFSEDGRTLVSAGCMGSILLWNVATARRIFALKEPTVGQSPVHVLCVAPNGISAVIAHELSAGQADVIWRASVKRPTPGN